MINPFTTHPDVDSKPEKTLILSLLLREAIIQAAAARIPPDQIHQILTHSLKNKRKGGRS